MSYNKKVFDSVKGRIPEPRTVEDFDELAIAHNETGVGLMLKGNIDKARKLLEKGKRYSERHRKESDTATSVYMLASANLGLAHWLKGNYEDSLNILMQAFQVYGNTVDRSEKKSFVPGRLMHEIGNVKASQALIKDEADFTKGFYWYQRAFRHYSETLGETHHRTADVCHRLAAYYLHDQQYDQAEDFVSRALGVFEGKECYTPEKMRTLHLKALLYEAMGKKQESVQLHTEVASMYRAFKTKRRESLPDTQSLTKDDMDASVTFWSR